MSNERLDLTQFENFEHFETAPWVVSPEEAQVVIIPANHESMEEMRLYTGSMTNSMAIAKVPELIAELKKCYEKIDWLQQAADLAADFIGDIHHSYWDRFEERMYEAGLWERPSEEE